MMTRKEIVLQSIQHKQPEVVPYHVEFTIPAYEKTSKYLGDPEFMDKIGNYLFPLDAAPKEAFVEVRPAIFRDSFGVEWNRTVDKDIGVVCNTMVTEDTIKSYVFPDPDDSSIYEKFIRSIPSNKDNFVYASIGFSLFERAWTLAGMENVLMAMAVDKDFINDLLDRILEYNLKVIAHCCEYDIDAMAFGDDWGQQTGIIMGPAKWREFIKPRVRQMYELVRSKGKSVIIHSCGKVDEIFPDLIECGVDVFNPFQPEAIDVVEAKRRFGNDLSFFGGISTQRTLPFGTVGDTKREVRRLMNIVGKDGGLIAAPAHAIPGDAKPENIMAMIEALHDQQ